MEFLKLKEVAAILKVSTPTLYAWRDTGKINFIKICGRNRIKREELDRFIKSMEKQTKTELEIKGDNGETVYKGPLLNAQITEG